MVFRIVKYGIAETRQGICRRGVMNAGKKGNGSWKYCFIRLSFFELVLSWESVSAGVPAAGLQNELSVSLNVLACRLFGI